MPGSKFKLLPGIIVLNRKNAICQFWSNRAKKKAVGEKIVIDAEDLLSIARELESSSNIVHINGKEYTGKKSWIANRLREIVASAPINR